MLNKLYLILIFFIFSINVFSQTEDEKLDESKTVTIENKNSQPDETKTVTIENKNSQPDETKTVTIENKNAQPEETKTENTSSNKNNISESEYKEFQEYKKKKEELNTKDNRASGNLYNSKWSIQFTLGAGESNWKTSKSQIPSTSSPIADILFLSLLSTPSGSASTSSSNLINSLLVSTYNQTKKIDVPGVSQNFRFHAEYRPKHFGYQFGTSSGVQTFTVRPQASDYAPIFLLQGNSISFFTGFPTTQKIAFAYNTFDNGLSFHFRPENTFDPYIILGVGAGICGPACSIVRGYGKLGLRVNFESMYIFFEREQQRFQISLVGVKEKANINEGIWNFGFGLFL